MNSATIDPHVVARLSDEDANSVHTDTPEGSSDSLARCWGPGSGSRTMHGIQSRKGKASGTGRRIEHLAKMKERCSAGSSRRYSHVRAPQYPGICRIAGRLVFEMEFW